MLIPLAYAGRVRTRVYREDQLDNYGDPLHGACPRWDSGFNTNLLLESFYEQFISGIGLGGTANNSNRAQLLQYVQASSETAAPAAGDNSITPLGTGRLQRASGAETLAYTGNKIIQTLQYRSTKGQVQGTVGKVALYPNLTGGVPSAASLVKDSGGAETTLPLGANDYFYVDWRFETTVSHTPINGVVTVPGEGDFNYSILPAYWNTAGGNGELSSLACYSATAHAGAGLGFNALRVFSSQTLGAVTSGPSGTNDLIVGSSLSAYTAGSKERDLIFSGSEANLNIPGGIGSMLIYSLSGSAGYQISFAKTTDGSKLNKINTKQLNLILTLLFTR